jgi:glycerophosphoryl diester phosphodiesterase
MPIDLPKRLAHRGASAIAPENTLIALEKAAALGASWVEFDVQLTRDEDVVVIHDWRVDRTTSGCGVVTKLSSAYVRSLSAGGWFSEAYAHEPVPFFSEWLALAIKCGLHLNIELKARSKSQAYALARAVRVSLAREPAINKIRLLLSSADKHCLAALKTYLPLYDRAYVTTRITARSVHYAKTVGCVAINPDAQHVTKRALKKAHDANLGVIAWTVNDAKQIKGLYDKGIDGIFSDVVAPE